MRCSSAWRRCIACCAALPPFAAAAAASAPRSMFCERVGIATNARARANAARIVAGPSAKGPRPKRGTQGTRKTAATTIAIICRSAKSVMRLQYVPAIA